MSHHDNSTSEKSPIDDTDSGLDLSCNDKITPEYWGRQDRYTLHVSDGEEQYECYGEAEKMEDDCLENNLQPNNSRKLPVRTDSSRSTGSLGSNASFQQRNNWLRTSLRRASGSSKRQSSNALASHLFRSAVANGHNSNSRASSISTDPDDAYSDQISLEDDVQDLNEKVHILEQQVAVLKERQSDSEDRYSRVKQENVTLMTRIQSLEDQIRELEVRSEEQVIEGEKFLKEAMSRQEKEKQQELESYTIRLFTLQQEQLGLKEEVIRQKTHIDKLREEKLYIQSQLAECTAELINLREEHKNLQLMSRREQDEFNNEHADTTKLITQLKAEIQVLKQMQQEVEVTSDPISVPHYKELKSKLHNLKEENKRLKETNEEIHAQLLTTSLNEGRSLLHEGIITASAQELASFSKEQVIEALKEQQEVNTKLKAYIDGILLNILENYPELLEVKSEAK